MKNKFIPWFILLLSLCGLIGCGGGSSSDTAELKDIIITSDNNSPIIDNDFKLLANAVYSDRTSADITTKVTWHSSDGEIATVDKNGLVKPLKKGEVTFSASFEETTGSKKFNIGDKPRVTEITLGGVPTVITEGKSYQLTIDAILTINDEEDAQIINEYDDFNFETSDETILIIDENGEIRPLSDGTATLTVSAKNSDKSESLEFIIKPAIKSIELVDETFYIDFSSEEKKSIKVMATYTDDSTADVTSQIKWLYSTTPDKDDFTSLNNQYVEIESNGVIKAKEIGTFYAIATLENHSSEKIAAIFIEEPIQLIVLKDYGNEIVVSWNAKKDATTYNLYWNNSGDIADNIEDIPEEVNFESFTESTEFTLSDIERAKDYYFRVGFSRDDGASMSPLSKELKIQPLLGDWNHKPGLQSLRHHSAAVNFDNYVYIFGGLRIDKNGETVVSDLTSEFDFENYKKEEPWINRTPNMPAARLGMAACRYQDSVYLFGGSNADDSLSEQIIKYLPLKNKWADTGLSTLPMPLSYASCHTVGDKIYIIGGMDAENNATKNVYIFDPLAENEALVEATPLIDARYNHASTVIGNTIYVAGGVDQNIKLDTFEILDTSDAEPEWVTLNRLKKARSGFSLALANDKLHAIGGMELKEDADGNVTENPITEVESIDWKNPDATWEIEKPMPFANANFAHITRNDTIYIYGGVEAAVNSSSLLANTMSFDAHLDKWYPSHSPETPVTDFASAILQNQLIINGGKSDKDTTTAQAQAFDLELSLWSGGENNNPRTPNTLFDKRRSASALTYRESIYLIGGVNQAGTPIMQVENYDPQENAWLSAGELKAPRINACIAVLNDQIYAFGGSSLTGELLESSFEIYEPANQTWINQGDMDVPRTGATCVTLNGRIYIIGGMIKEDGILKETNRVDTYIPGNFFSDAPADMREARIEPAATIINGNIYIFGGFQGGYGLRKTVKSIERYIPQSNIAPLKTNAWEKLARLPELPADFDHLEAHSYQNKILLIGSIIKDSENKDVENSILVFE